ncbi:hypothetical protein NEUTE1DRAFT_61273 [Neurospora tetrasperma FGSC 2508]|uniref:PHD-type domain-containing protein n=1 Tax=Neurospora tetrasperma (strain FGSC 2508 / ATCC MYA-4615 / P0657) TaxID=510951 RepID=F8MHP9_NEUT8|nr:uncharacterized protein NEUTE1DRAFT_61273 [Neurospora tetrasperma FGSC 2508]EGO59660.1 hypothetical protein NEUTE1DRAFT_61273 [Neurospora tetrasperma FGSC 2508]EGZ73795.1 hypothetical protein NEUTE2DRAFT_87361 [Neurospora tetrasperma FGSC 2509]
MADQTPNVGSQQTSKPSTPNLTPGSGPTISSSASTSSARPYVPQFSAATQLILQRLKAKEGKNDGGSSFSSVVSSKTTVITGSSHIKVEQDAFEDAKKRLVAGTGIKTSTSMSLKMPLVQPSIKMPTPAPTTTVKKNLSLPSASTAPRAASGSGSNSTTLSLPLPPPPPPPPPPKHKSLTFKSGTTSAIKNINSGLTASGKVSVVKPPKPPAAAAAAAAESKSKKAKTSTGNPVGRPPNTSKAGAAAAESSAATTNTTTGGGHRRKRIKQQQDADEFSSLSSLSDVSEVEDAAVTSTLSGAAAAAQTSLLTMTKSGRQVLKPTTYSPAAVDAANKKHRSTASTHHYGKRTAEQALCKKCTRMHSPAQNPMVFCDGCNEGWHQRCHDPRIETEVIRDPTKGWVCSLCVAKREGGNKGLSGKKGQQRRELLEQQQQQQQQQAKVATRESWADKPPQQKRAYLSTLPPQELVGLIMAALEVKPDLPIFPGSSPGTTSTFKGSNNNNNNSNSNGKGHKGSSGPNGKSLKDVILSRETSQENQGGEEGDEEEYDPLVALWPEPGKGLYSTLPFDVDDDDYMVDNGDFEAFSSIVYDDRGRKVLENGLRV